MQAHFCLQEPTLKDQGMKSNVTEDCLIIAIVLKISDEKRSCDKANIGKGKMWLLPPPVMMMEGVEEQEEELPPTSDDDGGGGGGAAERRT